MLRKNPGQKPVLLIALSFSVLSLVCVSSELSADDSSGTGIRSGKVMNIILALKSAFPEPIISQLPKSIIQGQTV